MNASMASQEDIVWQAARRPFRQALFLSNAAFPQAQRWRHKLYAHKSHSCGSITSCYLFLKLTPHAQQGVHQAWFVSSPCTLGKEPKIPFAQVGISSSQLPYTGEISYRRVGQSHTCWLQLKVQRQSPALRSAGPAQCVGHPGQERLPSPPTCCTECWLLTDCS